MHSWAVEIAARHPKLKTRLESRSHAQALRHMRIKTRLVWAFGGVALSALGYIQTHRLSSALYEIAVVRMPSVEALNGIEKTMVALNMPTATGEDRNRAWSNFDREWK